MDKYKGIEKAGGRDKNSSDTTVKIIKYAFAGLAALTVIAIVMVLFSTFSKTYVGSVGKEKITGEEFKFFLKQEKDNMLNIAGIQYGTPEAEEFWEIKIDGENTIDVAKKKALENIGELKVQVARARELGIKLGKPELENLENMVKQFIAQNENSKTKANETSREIYGVEIDEVKEIYKQLLLMQELYKKEIETMDVSEEEMKKYYEEHKQGYEEATVRHILISSAEGDTQEEKDEARKKAQDILEKVKAGEDFSVLAKEYSEDPGSKDNGGEYTFRRNGQMIREFEDWTFESNPGDTGIVETIFGFHVMKLEDKGIVTFEEANEEIKYMIKMRKYDEIVSNWLNDEKYELRKNQAVYDSIK